MPNRSAFDAAQEKMSAAEEIMNETKFISGSTVLKPETQRRTFREHVESVVEGTMQSMRGGRRIPR